MSLKNIFIAFIAMLLVLLGAIAFNQVNLNAFFTAFSALATAFAAFAAAYSASIAERASHTWKTQMRTEVELNEAKAVKVTLNAWKRHFISEAYSKETRTFAEIDEEVSLWYHDASMHIEHLNVYVNKLTELWNDFEKAIDSTNVIGLKHYHRNRLYQIHREHAKATKDLIAILIMAKGQEVAIPSEITSAIYNFKDWDQAETNGDITIYRVEAETFTQGGQAQKYTKSDGTPIYINPFQEAIGTWMNIDIQVEEKIEQIKNGLEP